MSSSAVSLRGGDAGRGRGWEKVYPPYLFFLDENREWEESGFRFADTLHWPEVEFPFDTIVHEAWNLSHGDWTARVFKMPPANGICSRIVNGRIVTFPLSPSMRIRSRPMLTTVGMLYSRSWRDAGVALAQA